MRARARHTVPRSRCNSAVTVRRWRACALHGACVRAAVPLAAARSLVSFALAVCVTVASSFAAGHPAAATRQRRAPASAAAALPRPSSRRPIRSIGGSKSRMAGPASRPPAARAPAAQGATGDSEAGRRPAPSPVPAFQDSRRLSRRRVNGAAEQRHIGIRVGRAGALRIRSR